MCEFCHKHGDGKKWYLQARNYSEELASDLERQRVTAKWNKYFDEQMADDVARVDRIFPRLPRAIRYIVSSYKTWRQKPEHFGQVVPIEDIREILQIVKSVVRTPCVCRRATTGKDVNYCFGIIAVPNDKTPGTTVDGTYLHGPDIAGMDCMTGAEAFDFMLGLEPEGIMHSVWTFGTPFVGGICNCTRRDCVATKMMVDHGMKMMFKAEYVASVDRDLCTGCRACMRLCQFGAMEYNLSDKKVVINQAKCYGCGTCRAACKKDAIALHNRSSIPQLARSW